MKKINVALIGYGFSGSTFHLPTIIDNPNYKIKYILTRNKTRQEEAREACKDVIIVTDYNQVLKDNDIDLVILATTNAVHYNFTKDALLHRKHVVCEKPFVETYEQAKELYDLADKNNLILRVFHNRKYDGDILTLKELLKHEDFGKIVSFSSRFDQYSPSIGENWRYKNVYMGGIFYDLAPHLVHYTVDLFGMPNKVYSKTFKDRVGMLIDDHFEMILYYDDVTCYLGAQMLDRDPKPKFQIVGTNATYSKDGFDNPETVVVKQENIYQENPMRSVLIDNSKQRKTIKLLKGKHYLFYENLREDIIKRPLVDEDKTLALRVIMIMEMAVKSANTNKEVKINKI